MKNILHVSFLFIILSFIFSCSNNPQSSHHQNPSPDTVLTQTRLAKNFLTDCKKLFREAKSLDSILLQQMEIDTVMATKAITAFVDFAYYCQSDSMSPVYLIKTAQVARAINNLQQAQAALQHCIDTYLNFENRAAALFMLAQLYEEPGKLNNITEAKRLYEKVISEYPKSDWALNAKAALKFLGKTSEEIVKEFEKQNKKSQKK